jgi:tight adherence protein C
MIQAGYREQRHITIYQGIRVLFAAVGFFSVVVVSGVKSPPLLLGVTALGFFIPRFFLKRKINDRQMRIRLGMPDALDLTVICVEAGLSLDQAMMRVGEDLRHAHPELADEFYLMNLELRAGKPRAEALRNLYNRTGVDDIKALVTTLVQTDRFGTSIAQALRVHSDSLRTERRQRAEEQAAKTTIKMVPPLVVFVLPSIIIVTLGPAIISLYRTLTA